MSASHFLLITLKKLAIFCGPVFIFFLVSCASLNPHDVQIDLQEDFPMTKITTFDEALVTLGQMTEIYDVRPLRIQCQQIGDFTGTSNSSTGSELPQSITEMLKSALNSIGGRVTFIPYDPAYMENSKITGYSQFEKKIIPDIAISGGITEFDRALETRGKNLSASADVEPINSPPDWLPGETVGVEYDQGQKTSSASITVDFNLIDFQTLSGIPRMQTVNTIKVYKGSNEKELGITLFGPTFGIKGSIKKVQGRHAAVRLLSQLSTIQIVGRYLKLPYWRLLPSAKPDKVVLEAIRTAFFSMNTEGQIAAIQRLLYLHAYDVSITGKSDMKTQEALKKFNAQASVNADTFVDLYVNVPLDLHRYLTVNQTISHQIEPASAPIPPAAVPAAKPIKRTEAKATVNNRPQRLPALQKTPATSPPKKTEPQKDTVVYGKVISMLTSLGLDTEPADLTLWTDQNQFLIGDRIHYYFKTSKDCHVVVIGLTTEGKVVQLFPNRYQSKPLVHSGQTYVIVDDQADTTIEVAGPAGQEEIIAFVSDHPFELFPTDFSNQPFYELLNNDDGLKKVSRQIESAKKQNISQKRLQYKIVDR